MISLPNNCNCSNPTVFPKNWKTGGKTLLKKNWRIQYWFRDPEHEKSYPRGKLVIVKGMNKYKTLSERRAATEELLELELYILKEKGFNPITKKYNGKNEDIEPEISPKALFAEAVETAFNKLDVLPKTKKDVEGIKNKFVEAVKSMGLASIQIKDVRRRQIRAVLEHQSKVNKYSNNRFNKARAYLLMIFKELLERDAIELNPVTAIPKKKETKRLRKTLTDAELKKIKKHLKANHYTFYRYVEIFFHSGARSTELMQVKRKDVDLKNRTFKITVKKGQYYFEELRAINKNAHDLWVEVCSEAKPNQYLFGRGLEPDDVPIDPWQISKRWREHVKKKLNIDADFYSLKHLHTVKVIEAYNAEVAANVNGHKSTAMNDRHYDIHKKQRDLERAKNLDIEF